MQSILAIQVVSRLLEHHAEDAEASQCQDATLLYAIGNGIWLSHATNMSDLAPVILMLLDHHLWKIGGTTKSFQADQ